MQAVTDGQRGSVQALAVELLCRAASLAPDKGLVRRALEGLATAVTSNTLEIHGEDLVKVRSTARAISRHQLCPKTC